jgi:DNA-binding FadR family transcriptional regulator
MLRGVRSVTYSWIGRNLSSSTSPEDAFPDHPPILDALVDQNPLAARAAMHTHMVRAGQRLMKTLDAETAVVLRARIGELLKSSGG